MTAIVIGTLFILGGFGALGWLIYFFVRWTGAKVE